jgi:hypothetical protein
MTAAPEPPSNENQPVETLPSPTIRQVFPAERLAFRRDGVILLRDALPYSWVQRLERGVERALSRPSLAARLGSDPSAGYQMESFLWKRDDDIRDAAFLSPLPDLAQSLLETERLHLLCDQLFTKQAGNQTRTPWHHDLTFWPVAGDQIVSFWCPVDPISKESGGLEFVAGSHRWPNRYKAVYPPRPAHDLRLDPNRELVNPAHEDSPTSEELRDGNRMLSWEMQPGDVIAFHPLVLHGSQGNDHAGQDRRAISLRYTGDDVRFQSRPYATPIPYRHGRRDGGPMGGPVFPQVLPARIPAEGARRDRGSERPDLRALLSLTWRPALAACGAWLRSLDRPRG